jgi:hypothetical protein
MPLEGEKLQRAVENASRDAYALARTAATGEVDWDSLEEPAKRIDARLDELVPMIQAAPVDEQPALTQAWNDARLDVSYVLSGGTQPTSLRLAAFLRNGNR